MKIIKNTITIIFIFCKSLIANDIDQNYIKKYSSIVVEHMKIYKIPASIKMAQAILESSFGTSYLAINANNHFGIKCKSQKEWPYKKIYHFDDNKKECFRRYNSVEESFVDHSIFLTSRPYYKEIFKVNIYNYKKWAFLLQESGYASDPYYPIKLINIIEKYKLYKLDELNKKL